jgi:beta-RFAP synthase
MNRRTVKVTAASRLHFGMFSFGRAGERQFGGVGAMIDRPGLALTVAPAAEFEVVGALAERTRDAVVRTAKGLGLLGTPACRVEVLHAPPDHVGLGTGTQLGLAVAAGLAAWLGREPLAADELARVSGRGERSAIGTHGFVSGGLLVEAGKYPGEALSPLVSRVELPSHWRFVLCCPQNIRGLSGDAERKAFDQLPPVPRETTTELTREVLLELLPAAIEGRFEEFGSSLYRYGHRAGLCFAAEQGGPFADQRSAALVESIRRRGAAGVGQSSWGPTIFALLPGQVEAEQFVADLRKDKAAGELALWIAAPDNRGAVVESIA